MAIDQTNWQKLLAAVYAIKAADNYFSFSEAVVARLSRIITANTIVLHVLDSKAEAIFRAWKEGSERKGLSLENIRQRLELLYGADAQLPRLEEVS